MKPFELTIYPKLERPRTGDEIMPYQKARRREMNLAESKRLTTAELAAEAYRQMTRALAESGIVYSSVGADINIVPGDAVTFGPVRRETAILGDVKRFATLPHYDEVTE